MRQGTAITVRKLPNGQETADPLSLHRYAYCHNNPVLYADPTGEFAITAAFLLIAGGIITLLGIVIIMDPMVQQGIEQGTHDIAQGITNIKNS